MTEEIYLGPCPTGEDCSQVGSIGYYERSRKECRAYINQLIRIGGEPPMGGLLKIKACPHDFGTYHEVVAVCDERFPDSYEWAFGLEEDLPEEWDSEAKVELTFLNIEF
jgi:hypothetical protein